MASTPRQASSPAPAERKTAHSKRVFSKLTSKAQTTVPRPVRDALRLGPGDVLAYEIDGDTVRLTREIKADAAYLRAIQSTLTEWDSAEDAAAYDDL